MTERDPVSPTVSDASCHESKVHLSATDGDDCKSSSSSEKKRTRKKYHKKVGCPQVQEDKGSAHVDRTVKVQDTIGTDSQSCKPKKILNNPTKKSSYGVHRITPMEKSFESYWSPEDVQRGLKSGNLIQGTLRINQRNFEESYLNHPDGGSDVCMFGIRDRNRALNGDVVCVCIYPKENWMASVEELNERMDDFAASFGDGLSIESSEATGTDVIQSPQKINSRKAGSSVAAAVTTPKSGQKQKNSKYLCLKDINSPVAKNLFGSGSKAALQSGTETSSMESRFKAIPDDCLVRTGKVVYIVEQVHSRACVGRIKPITDTRYAKSAFFSPNDSRVPRMIVSLSECPEEFRKRPEDFENTLFIARITDWKLNLPFAEGRVARSLGEAGEIEPETEGMLAEYDLDFGDFSADVLKCLPGADQWEIPDEEINKRRDLRKECIFTIDPATAKDLDDALSCRVLGPDLFEIGVHIADVSYFVKPDTILDAEAARRTTSVYLVQKVIPMLPHLLCERLCSLSAGQDRLCFSVVWKMNERGEIQDEWFGRTVIRSCVKLSYDHAQGFIQEPDRKWTAEELPPIHDGYEVDVIREVVLNLNRIAVNLRKKRFDGGALRLDQVKLNFTLDEETGLPNGWYVYEQRDSNRLVEEFMLLANMATACRIKTAFPGRAVLRRHPAPQGKLLDGIVSLCKELGVEIDAGSAGALQRSLYGEISASDNDSESKARLQVLVSLCSKPMQNARYFCTGTLEDEADFAHYALNVPLYTHFTSPIRRYPDIMVHRLLSAALEEAEPPPCRPDIVEKQCDLCNNRKTAAKRVSEMSADLFFAIFLRSCGRLEERGMVMAVLDKAFDVLVLGLGVVKRVYCEKLPLKEFHFSKVRKRPQLDLTWNVDKDHPLEIHQELTIFTAVCCLLVPEMESVRWNLEIKHPLDPYVF